MLNNKSNIVLIGFMATGKTTIGKLLSKKLNLKFIDTDELIETKLNKKISDVFNEYGERFFREQETNIVKDIYTLNSCVISCGGGLVLNKYNVSLLKENGVIVCLNASAEEIFKRTSNNTTRPLLKNTSIEQINKMLLQREQAYKNCDITINIDNLTIEEIVNKIVSQIYC